MAALRPRTSKSESRRERWKASMSAFDFAPCKISITDTMETNGLGSESTRTPASRSPRETAINTSESKITNSRSPDVSHPGHGVLHVFAVLPHAEERRIAQFNGFLLVGSAIDWH